MEKTKSLHVIRYHMEKQFVDPGFEVGSDTLQERILASFDGFEPRTAVEVATGLGISTTTVREGLSALVEDGELASKEVGEGVTVWYADPRTRATASGPRPAPETVDRRVETAVEGLDPPGTSELMVSWRRDAVRAAVEFLRETPAATPEEVVEAVYPAHSAGYEDSEEWWAMVSDRLSAVPGVATVDGRWLFDPAAIAE